MGGRRRRRRQHAQGATRGRSGVFLGLSFSGCVKCESRQSGRTLLARLGFAAISRRDLHCRVCGEEGGELVLRQASMAGLREDWESGLIKQDALTSQSTFFFFFSPAQVCEVIGVLMADKVGRKMKTDLVCL